MDVSQITTALYIGATPRSADYPALANMGVRLVINMRFERPPFKDPFGTPLKFLWLPAIDSPLFPISVRTLQRGVKAALETIDRDGKVLAHCAAGAHRGVVMGAAILIAQGHSMERALDLIRERRPGADPDAWYIRRRIERFAREWKTLR